MKLSIILAITCLFFNCTTSKKGSIDSNKVNQNKSNTPSPHVYIYKTKGDYYTKVPLILAQDKQEIVSYPAPSDLVVNGKSFLPTRLENGYYLDNKGIGKNVAFIKMDYSEYSKLKNPPSITELQQLIIDNDPLVELYDCGLRSSYKDIEKELNTKIKNAQLGTFKRIK